MILSIKRSFKPSCRPLASQRNQGENGNSASPEKLLLIAVAANASENPVRSGIVPERLIQRRPIQRRPVGVRLRFADVATGLRLHRTGAGAADRRAPRALRLLIRPSRNTGEARSGARPRPRRGLP